MTAASGVTPAVVTHPTDQEETAALEAAVLAASAPSSDRFAGLSALSHGVDTLAHASMIEEQAAEQGYGPDSTDVSSPTSGRRRKRTASPMSRDGKDASYRHVCEVCGYSTNHNWILKRHHLTHSGEKPFPCDVCGKAFRQKAHLAGHKRVHTGERSFFCNVCGEGFKRSDALKKHRQQAGHKEAEEAVKVDDEELRSDEPRGALLQSSESLTGIAAAMASGLGSDTIARTNTTQAPAAAKST